jgi:hypothetical protein
VGRRKMFRREDRRVIMVPELSIHVYKRKMKSVETIPGMGGGGIKENDGGGKFNYDTLYVLL